MSQLDEQSGGDVGACSGGGCCAGGGRDVNRREFLQLAAVAATAVGAGVGPGASSAAAAEQAQSAASSPAFPVPADKKLDPAWVRSLLERGAPTPHRGADTARIGMPVGGICTGQLYLGGDGKLWHWDIFNQHNPPLYHGPHYAQPLKPASPLDQGFAVKVVAGEKSLTRTLDRTGFPEVRFLGQYPIARVEYEDAAFPVRVSLEAFSPFIPLNADDSGLPVTVMRFTLRNASDAPVEAEIGGWLENATNLFSREKFTGRRRNRIERGEKLTLLTCSADAIAEDPARTRPPIVFADFESPDYGAWTVEGQAFGKAPATGGRPPQKLSGFEGKGLANSFPGTDAPKGRLTSPEFKIERPFIAFLIGGGAHAGKTCMNLLVGGKAIRTATGNDSDKMEWKSWEVRNHIGQTARLEIVDDHSGGWGHIEVDQIEFRDMPRNLGKLTDQADAGTMALAILAGGDAVTAIPAIGDGDSAAATFAIPKAAGPAEADLPLREKLRGALVRRLTLKPGESADVTFLVAWNFPNLDMPHVGRVRRSYAAKFTDASAVVRYVAGNFARLSDATRLWHKTWYDDSTLPHWALDRLFLNTSILASSTCSRWDNGRFYGWEGVGCCDGTCTHVWHYAHAVARIFPELERALRELTDFKVAFNEKTGLVRFRSETEEYAADGQCGIVLRSLREHQMSPDDAFLKRNWPRIRHALEFMIGRDAADGTPPDGVITVGQHNTLDTSFFGHNSMIASLYLAALRAGEEMAREVGDAPFADRVRPLFESGQNRLLENLFDGEYFVHKADPKYPDALKTGPGCFIDQVFGQSWAFQVALGRILPKEQTLSALRALWTYNFAPDVGAYRAVYKGGRWYAMPGESGLLMCTFPKGGNRDASGKVNPTFAAYLNECMNGFEYQAAGHMIWEGMVQEGLAICRALHDRYHPSKRNPWNEVECGDHYARSMASYGVYHALLGYEYHGPKGHIAFAPRLTPEDFRAAFTTAEGWGTYAQKRDGKTQAASIDIKHGKLRLRSVALGLPAGTVGQKATVTLAGKAIEAELTPEPGRIVLKLPADLTVEPGRPLEITVTFA